MIYTQFHRNMKQHKNSKDKKQISNLSSGPITIDVYVHGFLNKEYKQGDA